MKLKLISILTGAIALTVAATPLAVKAEPTAPLSQPVPTHVKGIGKKAGINLTQEQKAQMAEIHRDTKAKIDALLTPQQREQLNAARESRQGWKATFAALNLSEDQKTQMRTIVESAKSRSEAVLTEEQREQLQQMQQSMKQRWQQQQNQ